VSRLDGTAHESSGLSQNGKLVSHSALAPLPASPRAPGLHLVTDAGPGLFTLDQDFRIGSRVMASRMLAPLNAAD
jgi:hypothetical protein